MQADYKDRRQDNRTYDDEINQQIYRERLKEDFMRLFHQLDELENNARFSRVII